MDKRVSGHAGGGPRISVIIAIYNGAETLVRCIDSVAGQTYQNRELIVIDGGSTDGTVDILKARSGDIAYWESEPDRGIYHAWNKALGHATGDWICFLGADDRLAVPDALEFMAPHLERAEMGHRLVYGDVARTRPDGAVIETVGRPWSAARFRRANVPYIHQGMFHHRSLFEEIGMFDTTFRIAGDYEWVLRASKVTTPRYVPNVLVAAMEIGGVSSDDRSTLLVLSEYARALRQQGLSRIPASLTWLTVKAIVKSALYRFLGGRVAHVAIDTYRVLTFRPRRWRSR